MLANPLPRDRDPIGALQWSNFRTGKVTRWTVLRGDRGESLDHRIAFLLVSHAESVLPHNLAGAVGERPALVAGDFLSGRLLVHRRDIPDRGGGRTSG